MRRTSVSQVGVGNSTVMVHDYNLSPFNVSLSTVVTGNTTYTVQHTFDDVFAASYVAASGNWFNHDNVDLVNATTNQNDNYNFPVTASRIHATSGNGTVTLTAIQGTSGA